MSRSTAACGRSAAGRPCPSAWRRKLRQPDVLLLDEPTNNLDLDARRKLYSVLEEWKGLLLLVSHDRALLDRMDRIAELDRGEIRFHGGNHTDYEEAVRSAREVAEKNIRNAEQGLKREKRELQTARERAARRAGNASRTIKSAGLSRIHAGNHQRRAHESAGKANDLHSQRVSDARARLDEAGLTLRDEQKIALALPGIHVPAGRTVFEGRAMQVRYGVRTIFAGDGADLTIRGPERIGLLGPNGSGKSTLLRVVGSDLEPESGDVRRADGRIAYLSQRLDLLDPDRTVAENLRASAPEMPDAELMHLLTRFFFRGSRIRLPARVLSGGERLRATLACILYSEPAPQLLLLDEPTKQPRPAQRGTVGERARRLRGRTRGGQPRRPVPLADQGRPLAPAVRGAVGRDGRTGGRVSRVSTEAGLAGRRPAGADATGGARVRELTGRNRCVDPDAGAGSR
jgi:ATPase subunit of ABC transporter with duplicated ATPase domains